MEIKFKNFIFRKILGSKGDEGRHCDHFMHVSTKIFEQTLVSMSRFD